MKCAEKDELQRSCTAAWNAYAAAVKESGLSLEQQGGTAKPPTIGALLAWRSGSMSLSSAYADALRLRGAHLRASIELSRHLARHRC